MPDLVTERIALLLEGNAAEHAGAAALAVERMDKSLAKVEESTSAAGKAASNFEAVLAKEGATAEEVGKSFQKLTQELKNYDKAQARKRERNAKVEESRQDSRFMSEAMARASRVPTELQQAPKALTAGQKAFQAFSRAFGPRATQGLVSTVETIEKIGPIASKIGPPLASAAMAAGAVAIAAAGAGAYAAKEFGGAVIEAQKYKEDLLEAFKIVRRTQGDADEVMKMAVENADRLGIKRAEGAGQFLELLSKGFDPQETKRIVSSLADLSTVDPKASIDSLTRIIGKVKAMGKFSQDAVSELSTAGLEAGDVYVQLSKITGKSQQDVQKMLSTGKIDAGQGIEAVLRAVNSQVGGGGAGDAAAAKADRNLSSLIDRVKDIPSNILFDVQAGPGIENVKGILRDVLGFFDGSTNSGKEVRAVVGDLFNSLVEGLTGNKVDTSKGITGTLDTLLAGAKEAVPVVRDLASGAREMVVFARGLMGAAGSVVEFTGGLGNIRSALNGLSFPGRLMLAPMTAGLSLLPELYQGFRGIGALLDGDTSGALERFKKMVPGGELFGPLTASISGLATSIGNGASLLIQEAMNLGSAVIDGITQGITGGAARAWAAISGVATGIIDTAKSVLRSNSPSKVMIDLGADTSGGLPLGMEKKAPAAFAAAHDVGSGVAASVLAGMKPANDVGSIAALAMEPGRPANANAANAVQMAMATNAAPRGGGTVMNVTFAPVIKADGGRSEAENRAAAAAVMSASQEEFDRMLAVSMRRMRMAGGF